VHESMFEEVESGFGFRPQAKLYKPAEGLVLSSDRPSVPVNLLDKSADDRNHRS